MIYKDLGVWKRFFYDHGIVLYYVWDTYSHYEAIFKVEEWRPIPKDYEYNRNFGSIDIETFRLLGGSYEGLAIPRACGFEDSKGRVSTFKLESKTEDPFNVVVRMIQELFSTTKYHNHIFYIHNLTRFDGRFIMEALGMLDYTYKAKCLGLSMTEVFKIIIKKKVGSKVVSITLMDSHRILPVKLSTLGQKFKVKTPKGVFPHDFVTVDTLFYEGVIPEYKYFSAHISIEKYEALKSLYSDTKK
jgi:hypothetical protein